MAGIPSIDNPSHLSRGYGDNSHLNVGVSDFANGSAGSERRGRFDEDFDARTRGSSIIEGHESLLDAERGLCTVAQWHPQEKGLAQARQQSEA
jgi:hypothetical protein